MLPSSGVSKAHPSRGRRSAGRHRTRRRCRGGAQLSERAADGRLVKSARESTGKRHGPSAKKIGNAHRKWAFSEAAGLFLKNNAPAQKYLATLATRHGKGKALSILAHKLGRAVYYMLKHQEAFNQEKFLAT